jgi:predicted metal-dependent peptidase
LAIYKDLVDKLEDGSLDPGSIPDICGCCIEADSAEHDIPQKDLPEPMTTQKVVFQLGQIEQLLKGNNQFSSILEQIGKLTDSLARTKLDWVDELKDTFRKSFDGLLPNLTNPIAQYMPDIYIPKLKDETVENIYILLDISGSLTHVELGKAQKVINDLREEFEIEKTIIITYNSDIVDRKEYEQYQSINISELPGGGGTKVDAVFRKIHQNCENPNAVLVITDTEDDVATPAELISYPVIWLNTSEREPFSGCLKPKFGKIISI